MFRDALVAAGRSPDVEILRKCGTGAWTKVTRRAAPQNELLLEITEQRADGRRLDRRLIFAKQ